MFCMTICGMELAIDFTAPALLALLSLYLPRRAFYGMCAACVLHEGAHFLMILLLGQRPSLLRVSATGLRLEMRQDALCPLPVLSLILLAGAAANLLAGMCFSVLNMPEAVQAHVSLGLFNLLPYRSTDGGTLLYAVLEHRLIAAHPARLREIGRVIFFCTTLLLAALLLLTGCRNLSAWGMLLFMTASELPERCGK